MQQHLLVLIVVILERYIDFFRNNPPPLKNTPQEPQSLACPASVALDLIDETAQKGFMSP